MAKYIEDFDPNDYTQTFGLPIPSDDTSFMSIGGVDIKEAFYQAGLHYLRKEVYPRVQEVCENYAVPVPSLAILEEAFRKRLDSSWRVKLPEDPTLSKLQCCWSDACATLINSLEAAYADTACRWIRDYPKGAGMALLHLLYELRELFDDQVTY